MSSVEASPATGVATYTATAAEQAPRLKLAAWSALGLLALGLAIRPLDRDTWLLENMLVVLLGLTILLVRRRLLLSLHSTLLLVLFLALHELGSHYTYSLVPYDAWFRELTGHGFNELLGWQRNNYDRLVHFCSGLLLTNLLREALLQQVELGGFLSRFVPVTIVMSSALLYELIEWGSASVFGGDLGPAFLGTQGDGWDAQKDMALATLGSLLAMLASLLAVRLRASDRAAELARRVRSARR